MASTMVLSDDDSWQLYYFIIFSIYKPSSTNTGSSRGLHQYYVQLPSDYSSHNIMLDTMTSHSFVNYKFTTRIGLHVAQDHDKVLLSNSAKDIDIEGHVIGHVNVRVKV
jgi:hypothetical protein